jgi:CD109 antigen
MNNKKRSIYVQTDKSIYKPGDKVQFRILILNGETKPVAVESMQVYITDANYNRIKQYEKANCIRGVYAQELQLSEEPVLGVWGIHVLINDEDSGFVKNFEIAEYVLPKFDVSIITKSKISKNDDIIVTYSAKYTYGKDVEGTAVVTARALDDWWAPTVERTLDNTTKTISFNLQNDLNIQIYWTRTIEITLTFTEALTGVQRTATSTVTVYNVPYTISITGSGSVIRPNLPFVVSAVVKDFNEVPTTDVRNPITFGISYTLNEYDTSYWYYWWWQPLKTIYENRLLYLNNGIADLTLNVTPNVTAVSISTSYMGAYGYYYASVKPTESDQYLSIKVPSETLSPTATSQIDILSNVNINSVDYVIFGRNKVAKSGQLNAPNSKSFKLNLVPTAEMIPSAKLIAFYVTTNGEIISDFKVLTFDNELRNFVSLVF